MLPEVFYHIYNHANGSENLFHSDENYHYFLRQWAKYIEPVAETFAYCLMPNHIHFLIRLRAEHDVSENLGYAPESESPFGKFETFQKAVSKQFANLFSSYAQAFNKMYDRRGSLFIPNFKHKEITSDSYLTSIVNYIHRNPVHHGFTSHPEDWLHSSYHAYIQNKASKLNRTYILKWFSGKEEFANYHKQHRIPEDRSLLVDY